MDYDLIVIGGGPAGYVGAIRAAQMGKKVACVEKERAGGTCLNWGCIPTKSLLRNAEVYHLLRARAAEFGLVVGEVGFDWDKIIGRSRQVADRLAGGIEFLFRKNKIDYRRGSAALAGPGTVAVQGTDGAVQTLAAERILIATGATAKSLPGLPFDGATVIGSREAMVIPRRPERVAIIGAGAIGVEFAYFFNAFGSRVTLLEMMPQMLPAEDHEVAQALEKAFKKQGITVLLGTKVAGAEIGGGKVVLAAEGAGGQRQQVEADVCLVAVGVQALVPGGSAGLDVRRTDRGFVAVDDRYETSVPGVFAAGDVIGPPWLAHVASFEAIQAVEGMFEPGHRPRRAGNFPGCTYCQPQVASCGLTERAARDRGLAFKVGKFPFQASGKALAVGEGEGFVKLLLGEPHGEILGAHIIGAEATELIAELGLAIGLEATADELGGVIHAHPTLSEAIHEAAAQAYGHAIHI